MYAGTKPKNLKNSWKMFAEEEISTMTFISWWMLQKPDYRHLPSSLIRLKFFQVQQRQFYDIWKWFEHFRNICSENDTATLFQEVDSSSAFENEPMHLKMKRNEAEYRCAKQLNLAAQPLRRYYVCKRGGCKGFHPPFSTLSEEARLFRCLVCVSVLGGTFWEFCHQKHIEHSSQFISADMSSLGSFSLMV